MTSTDRNCSECRRRERTERQRLVLDVLRQAVDADVARYWPECCAPITALGVDVDGQRFAVLVHGPECDADLEDRQAWVIGAPLVASILDARDPRPALAGHPQ